jgi:hypothetical protein
VTSSPFRSRRWRDGSRGFERGEPSEGSLGVVHECGFGDFEDEPTWVECRVGERGAHVVDDVRVVELFG